MDMTKSSVGAILFLVIGVAAAVMSLIFVGVLGGQTYQMTESKLTGIGWHTIGNETWDNMRSGVVHNLSHAYGTWDIVIYNTNDSAKRFTLSAFTIDYYNGQITLTNGSVNGTYATVDYVYGNTTIENSIKDSILSGFSALNQTGSFIPIIVLAIIIVLVLGIIFGFVFRPGMAGGGGMAL